MVITDIYDTIMRLLYPSFCLVGGELRVDRKLGGEGMFLVSLADVILDSYPFLVFVAIPVALCFRNSPVRTGLFRSAYKPWSALASLRSHSVASVGAYHREVSLFLMIV